MMVKYFFFPLSCLLINAAAALQLQQQQQQQQHRQQLLLQKEQEVFSRRNWFESVLKTSVAGGAVVCAAGLLTSPRIAGAVEDVEGGNSNNSKKLGLSDDQLREIVSSDILEGQFLVTGTLTPSIYEPTATFTDEIDTYEMNQWIKGTQKLFVGEKSQIRLVGDVQVDSDKVEFRFDEDLMFRIPFRPTVALTGKVVLERNPETGFIKSYREFWDQDVWSVLKTAKF